MCQSAEILEETERVLLEPGRIREHFQYSDRSVRQYVHGLRVVSQLVTRIPKIHVVSRDPNDDMVIGCALKAKADYLISRDKDLLSLTRYKTVKIISPEECVEMIRDKRL